MVNLFKRFYLFIFRERGREGEREGEKHQCVVASLLGTWPATQACALTGNQLATLWFTGWHSVYWATPARAENIMLKERSQSQRSILWYNLISTNVQNTQFYGYKKQISDGLGLVGLGENREWLLMGMRFLLGVMEMFKSWFS